MLSQEDDLGKGSANFFCKEADGKYFKLCSPYSVILPHFAVVALKQLNTLRKWIDMAEFQLNFIYGY